MIIDDYYSPFIITEEKEQQILKRVSLKLGVSLLPRIFEKRNNRMLLINPQNLRQHMVTMTENTTTDELLIYCNEIPQKI